MGIDIQQDHFSSEEHQRFGIRIRDNLNVLRTLLARPGFGVGPMTLGAELEWYLVDAAGAPVEGNLALLQLHMGEWDTAVANSQRA